jgi:hypothetical protein
MAKKKSDTTAKKVPAKKKGPGQTPEQRNANLRPFVKGDPRINRKGRPKTIPKLHDIFKEVLGGLMEDGQDSGIAQVIKNIFEQAKDRKNRRAVNAAALLLDRLYGKAPQTIEIKGEDIVKQITGFNVVRKNEKDSKD